MIEEHQGMGNKRYITGVYVRWKWDIGTGPRKDPLKIYHRLKVHRIHFRTGAFYHFQAEGNSSDTKFAMVVSPSRRDLTVEELSVRMWPMATPLLGMYLIIKLIIKLERDKHYRLLLAF